MALSTTGKDLRRKHRARPVAPCLPRLPHDSYPWAREPIPPGVYDVRLPVPESNRKAFNEQRQLFLPDEEPLPLVVAEFVLLHCHIKGFQDPIKNGWVRCCETTDGSRVVLGWGGGRLEVGYDWGACRNGHVFVGAGIFRG